MKTKSYDGNGLPVLLSQGELAVCTGERRLWVFTGQIILQVKGVVCRRQNPDVGIGQNVNVNVFYRIQLLFSRINGCFSSSILSAEINLPSEKTNPNRPPFIYPIPVKRTPAVSVTAEICQNDFFTFLHVFVLLF